MNKKTIRPKYISTDQIIKVLDQLIEEEYNQPRSISEPILEQMAGIIRAVTGKKVQAENIGSVRDVYALLRWEYKIKGREIEFLPPTPETKEETAQKICKDLTEYIKPEHYYSLHPKLVKIIERAAAILKER